MTWGWGEETQERKPGHVHRKSQSKTELGEPPPSQVESHKETRETPKTVIGRSRAKKDTLRYSHREIRRGRAVRDGELQGDMDKGETFGNGEA